MPAAQTIRTKKPPNKLGPRPAASNQIVFKISQQPIQTQAFDLYETSPATKIGMGGSRGGTKSFTSDDMMIYRRSKFPGTIGFMIMKTLDDLRDIHIQPLLRRFPVFRGWYNKQEKLLSLPNGSTVRFISSDDEGAIFGLTGKEAADIMVDQAEKFSQEELEFLFTVNRCTSNDDIVPKCFFTFNPGGKGHAYLKRVFVTRSDFMGNEDPNDFAFLRAYGWDNAFWCRPALKADGLTIKDYNHWDKEKRFKYFIERSNYGKNLNGLPDNQRKAQLYGDFDTYEGQFFADWRYDLHVIDPMMPPAGSTICAGLDYGERTVLEAGFMDYEGNVVTFLEVFTEGMAPKDRAKTIAEVLIERQLKRLEIHYDTNMEVHLGNYVDTDKTPLQTFNEVFLSMMGEDKPYMIPVQKKNTEEKNYRAVVNEVYREYLSWQKNDNAQNLPEEERYARKPRHYVTRNCKKLIECIPLLQTDKNSTEGLDFVRKVVIEDPYDADKYMLKAILGPLGEKKVERAEDYDQYVEQNIFRPKILAAMKPKGSPVTM